MCIDSTRADIFQHTVTNAAGKKRGSKVSLIEAAQLVRVWPRGMCLSNSAFVCFFVFYSHKILFFPLLIHWNTSILRCCQILPLKSVYTKGGPKWTGNAVELDALF